jgi:NTE family protein
MTAETKMGRRDLIAAGALVSATAFAAPSLAQTTPTATAGAMPAGWSDGLAHPIPYTPSPGLGKERGLVLGGGGAYLVSWMMGYFHALKQNGVDLATADVVVGTSAGSVAGAVLSSGRLWRLTGELDFFRDFPKLFAELVPALQANLSQERARRLEVEAKDASFKTIRDISRAAMAARNPAGTDKYFTTLHRLIGPTTWPSPALHTTANDCYTGERIVVSASAGLPVDVACAASSSLPGSMGPTWLKGRLCMDGGICQTSTHSDVVAGVKRALVISLSDGGPQAVAQGLRTSGMPNTLHQEIRDLEAGGTRTMLTVAGLAPGIGHVDNIMDPKWIGPMLKYGHERGLAELPNVKALWT